MIYWIEAVVRVGQRTVVLGFQANAKSPAAVTRQMRRFIRGYPVTNLIRVGQPVRIRGPYIQRAPVRVSA